MKISNFISKSITKSITKSVSKSFCKGLVLLIPYLLLSLNLNSLSAQTTNSKIQADRQVKAAENLVKVNALPQAEIELGKALRFYQSTSDLKGQRLVLIRLSQLSYQQGEYLKANQYLQQAQRIASREQESTVLSMQGLIKLEMGEYAQALPSLRAAQGRLIPDLEAENRNRIGLGEALHGTGAYSQALALLQVAVKSPGDRFSEARSINAIADVYFSLGQYEQAETSYQRALQARKSIGDRGGISRTLRNLGKVNLALKKYQPALKNYQDAMEQMSGQRDFIGQMELLNDFGLLAIEQNNLSEAERYLQEALAATRLSNGVGRGQTLTNLGYLHLRKNQFELAIENFEEGLAWARKQSDRAIEIKALTGLGEARLGLGQPQSAIEILQLGIQTFESLRPGLRDRDKVALFDTNSHAYRLLQKAFVTQNQSDQALAIAERGRARAFIELLAQRQSDQNLDRNREIVSQPPASQSAAQTLSQIQNIAKQSAATIVTYSIIYGSDRRETAQYIWVIKPDGVIYFRQVNLQKTIKTSISTFANQSRSGAAIGEDSPDLSSFVLAVRGNVTNKTSKKPNVGVTGRNDTRSNNLVNSSNPPKPALISLQNAYQLLIQPIAELLPSDPEAKVIFIPQDSLFLIPFAALQDSNGKFLIEKHTVQISPSIEALSLLAKSNPNRQNKSAVVVGNPSPMPQKLEALPGSEVEAKAIAQVLKVQAIIGSSANKLNILDKIKQAPVIHFATHGLLNDREVLQSALALSTSNGDGLLTAAEIFDLKLEAELAILSACNTGRGKITGDGVIGLSRSLIAAGVSNVIVSLWSVPDQPTAELMTAFYMHWQKRPDKSHALRKAMLDTIQKYPNPRDWAGFVLVGKVDN
jgi:CHAT domain-containing protein/tetratricopeptide (TPR) repeat protein